MLWKFCLLCLVLLLQNLLTINTNTNTSSSSSSSSSSLDETPVQFLVWRHFRLPAQTFVRRKVLCADLSDSYLQLSRNFCAVVCACLRVNIFSGEARVCHWLCTSCVRLEREPMNTWCCLGGLICRLDYNQCELACCKQL